MVQTHLIDDNLWGTIIHKEKHLIGSFPTTRGEEMNIAAGNQGRHHPGLSAVCVHMQHAEDGGPPTVRALVRCYHSPKNCAIKHSLSSLMHVHLGKAQENNYPSLLYRPESPEDSANAAAKVWNASL